jgi:hypothetical protein
MNNKTFTRRHLAVFTLIIGFGTLPAHAAHWGIKSWNPPEFGSSYPPSHLFRFEDSGASFSDLGRIGGTTSHFDALALSLSFGLLAFRLEAAGSTLVSINRSNAAFTVIGTLLSGRQIRGATFDTNDHLWVLDAAQNQVLRITPTDGLPSGLPVPLSLDGTPFDLSDFSDLTVTSDGAFIVTSSTRFFRLDLTTGALTPLYADPSQTFPGVIALPLCNGHDGFVTFEANNADDLFQFDEFFLRAPLYLNIISTFNAGTGDLATSPPVPGDTTLRVSIFKAVEVCWPSQTNMTYQLQYVTEVNSTNWTNLGATQQGTGSTLSGFDFLRGRDKRFYRVITVP